MSENHSKLNENKRVQTLCRLSPSSVANVKCRKLNSGRYVTAVFSSGNKLLHVMENHKINCVISLGSCILRILDYVDERDELWIVTKDGKLWTVPIPLHQENEQKGVFQINQPTNQESAQPSPNHDIFAELLSDNNKDIPHSLNRQTQNALPFSNVCQCSDNYITHWEEGLQNVAIGTHHIITCSSNNGDVRLTIYPWIKQNNDGKREIASNFLYQTILPKHLCNPGNSGVTVLFYVSPCKHPSSKCVNSTLDHQLFGLLFLNQLEGNFPVVLVGLQSGFIGYQLVGIKNLNPNLQRLYHLEQKVVSIFAACLKPPLPKGGRLDTTPTCNALGLLGALGKLVLLTQGNSKGLAGGILIREYYVPGPVVSATMNKSRDTLFYSTLKEIYVVKLEAEGNTEDKVASISSLPSSLSPITLNIPKVLALSADLAEKEDSMVCVKKDGCVLRVVPRPLSEEISLSSTSVVSTAGGEQIKKYLGEIQEKTSHVKWLRDEIHQLDEVIKQLNLVTQVFCEILRNRKSQNDPSSQTFQESNQAGISFNVDVNYEAQGASLNPHVILRCDLANSTKFSFSSNWSLVIQVETAEPWFNESCSVRASTSHSVSLSTEPVHHISIPMEGSLSYLTPIQVSCYVCFCVEDLLPVFLKESEPALAEEGFTVLVSKTELNILHFLRKQKLWSSAAHDRRHPTCLLANTLKSLNTMCVSEQTPELVQQKSTEFCTFSVRLSEEAVDFIQKTISDLQLSEKKSETIPKQTSECNYPRASEDNLLSQEACVLQFILYGSRRHLCRDDMKYAGGHVVGRTPSEEVVKFQVVKLGQVGSTGGMKGLEVRVHSSSQAVGCAVQSAVMKILKPVLERNTEQTSSVPIVELQKQLIKLKELQTSLDLLRPSFQCEETSSTEEDRTNEAIIEKLISIYSDLRKINTVIP